MLRTLILIINTAVATLLIGGLIAGSMVSLAPVNVVTVPATFSWSQTTEGSLDAFVVDGAKAGEEILSAEASESNHPAVRESQLLAAAGRIGEARDLLESIIQADPKNAGLRNALGNALLKDGSFESAALAFEAAKNLQLKDSRYPYNLGLARFRMGDFEGAIEEFSAALEINPYYAEARYNLALAYSRVGRINLAEQEYRQIGEAVRGQIGQSARFNLGVILMRGGRLDDALDEFIRVLYFDPSHIDARFNRALLLGRLQSEDEAKEQYLRLLDLRPEHLRARLNLAALYIRSNECGEAEPQLSNLVERSPNYALAHYNLGVCALREDRANEAVSHLNTAVQLEPDMAAGHYNLALAASQIGEDTLAVESYGRAVAQEPSRANYRYNYGVLLSEAGRFAEALEQYEAATRLEPTYFEAFYNAGLMYFRVDDYAAAESAFRQALEIRPNSYEAIYNQGLARLKAGDLELAEESFLNALALERTVAATYNLGLALFRQGRMNDAAKRYEAALRIDPKHAPSLERLAETMTELGSHQRSLKRLEQLGRMDPEDPTALNTGLRLMKSGDIPTAEKYLELADTLRDSRKARYNLASVRMDLGKHEEARTGFARLVEDSPEDELYVEKLAEVLFVLKRHQESIDVIKRLLTLDPEDTAALNAGLRLMNSGDAENAEKYLELANSARSSRKVIYNLASVRTELGKLEEALEGFARLAEEAPEDELYVEKLAETLFVLERHTESIEVLKRLLALDSEDTAAMNFGIRLLRDNEYLKSIDYLELAAEAGSRVRPRSLELIGRSLSFIDPDAALNRLVEAQKEFPEHAGIQDRLRRVRRQIERAGRG